MIFEKNSFYIFLIDSYWNKLWKHTTRRRKNDGRRFHLLCQLEPRRNVWKDTRYVCITLLLLSLLRKISDLFMSVVTRKFQKNEEKVVLCKLSKRNMGPFKNYVRSQCKHRCLHWGGGGGDPGGGGAPHPVRVSKNLFDWIC